MGFYKKLYTEATLGTRDPSIKKLIRETERRRFMKPPVIKRGRKISDIPRPHAD